MTNCVVSAVTRYLITGATDNMLRRRREDAMPVDLPGNEDAASDGSKHGLAGRCSLLGLSWLRLLLQRRRSNLGVFNLATDTEADRGLSARHRK